MDDKTKKKKTAKKNRTKREDMACYDLCDPCIDYYIVDSCGCMQYVNPCGCC